ncbi:MAG TPA: tetratricopeptide repeat protein [Bryobacteraceae bacterium]|nr:tetratricopeptide repeat protein [Bryobacteraceae bacterium]
MRAVAFVAFAAWLAGPGQQPADLFDKAVSDLKSGDYAAAETGFQEILRQSPNHINALRNLGVVYSRTGRLDQAVSVYLHALEVDPRDRTVLLNLGLVYMRQNSYGSALNAFQNLVRNDPQSLPARDVHLLLPLCNGYLKQSETAEERTKLISFLASVQPAVASLVRCKLSYQSARFEQAETECRRALEIDPNTAGAHLALARIFVSQQNENSTIELAAAMRENPTDPEDLYDLGVALLQVDRVEEASDYLRRAQRLTPDFWGTYYHLGRLKLRANQPAEAVVLLRKAVELNQTSSSVFYELGRALMATGHTEEAQRVMERVRQLMTEELEQEAKAVRKR